MTLAFKIYQHKEHVASTATAIGAAHMAQATPRAVIRHGGRVVWNDVKDGGIQDRDAAVRIIRNRVEHHRQQAVAKYNATHNLTVPLT